MSSDEQATDIPYQLYYLEYDFAPETVTRYQLQAILQAHGIDIKKSMKKSDLVKLFKKHILRNRDAILAEYWEKERLKHEEEEKQSEESERAQRARRRTKTPEDEDESETPPLLKYESVQGASLSMYPAVEDTYKVGDEKEPLSTWTESSVNNFANIEESDSYNGEEYQKQSMSEQTRAAANGSKSSCSVLNRVNHAIRSLISGRSKPETPKNDFPEILMQDEDEDEDEDFELNADEENEMDDHDELYSSEPDEDLDSEEIRALIRDLKQSPQEIARQARMRYIRDKIETFANKTFKTFKDIVHTVRSVTLLALLLIFFNMLVITLARKKVGYCSEVMPRKTFGFLPPACIPCPDHGTCIGGQLTCDRLYKRRHLFYNPSGILPIADECVLDSAIGKSVAQAEKRIKAVLARKQGKAECNYLLNSEESGSESSVPMVQTKLSDVLERAQQYGEFNNPMVSDLEVLSFASKSVLSDPHIYHWDIDGEVYLATDRTKFSIACSARLLAAKIPSTAKKTALALLGLLSVLLAVWYQYIWKVQARERFNARVLLVVQILEEQLKKHADNPEIDPACSVISLRSKITDTYPVTPEEWGRICQILRKLGKVRQSFRDVNGEPREYWELVG